MNSQKFGLCCMNADILICIYKYLNFRDQLSLSCVSGQMHDCFVNFIMKEPYRALNIYRRLSGVAITNGIHANSAILNQSELRDFLLIYAGHVNQLCENFPTPVMFLVHFRNLTSYSLDNKPMPHEHLELVAECCPNLQNLQMFEVVCGINIIVNTLMSMRNLKRLTLKYADYDYHMEYSYFRDFVCKLNLDMLSVQATLAPSARYNDTNSNQPQLRELTIRTSFNPDMWHNSFRSYLTNFANLTRLTFQAPDGLYDMNLRLISETCGMLKFLTIQHTIFLHIKMFHMPTVLSEFALEHCAGLSWDNFKEILRQPSLVKFTTIGTVYNGDFEDFPISPYIKKLYLEGSIYMHIFKSAYCGNTSLRELTWNEADDCFYEVGQVIDVPLEACPNLQTVVLKGGFVPLGSLMQLKHLNKLKITIQDSTPLISWTYITELLKHPSLTELTLDSQSNDVDCLRGPSEPPADGFPTKIKYLTLSCDIFEQELDFWLDLFCQNLHLQLACQYFYTNNPELLDAMVYHDKFPMDLRVIDVWGFTIQCHELRDDFYAVTGRLVENRMQLHPDVLDINQIIMRRGQ